MDNNETNSGGLSTVFGAVASCALVHVFFAAVGAEPLFHAAGYAINSIFTGVEHIHA